MYGIASFFSEEPRLIKRGENAVKSGHMVAVQHHWELGTLRAQVQASMKDKSYDVSVSSPPGPAVQLCCCFLDCLHSLNGLDWHMNHTVLHNEIWISEVLLHVPS